MLIDRSIDGDGWCLVFGWVVVGSVVVVLFRVLPSFLLRLG
jgi:hypothetical protein